MKTIGGIFSLFFAAALVAGCTSDSGSSGPNEPSGASESGEVSGSAEVNTAASSTASSSGDANSPAGPSSSGEPADSQQDLPTPAPATSDWICLEVSQASIALPPGWQEPRDLGSTTLDSLWVATDFTDEQNGDCVIFNAQQNPLDPAKAAAQISMSNLINNTKVKDATLEKIPWPGAVEAWYADVRADVPQDDGSVVARRITQIYADMPNGHHVDVQLNFVDHDQSDTTLETILASLELTPAAG